MNTNQIPPTVEEKAESKGFFTKRNIVIIVLLTIVSLGLAAITLFVVFDVEMWKTFFVNIGHGLTINFGTLWLTILACFALINIAYNMIPIWVRLKQMGIKIRWWQWFCFSLSISFLKAVTPANFIYDPYTVFWLKTQGVSTSRATSIMFSNALMWQSAVLLIHIPSFILILTRGGLHGVDGTLLIVFMSIGLLIDIIGVLVMVLLCFSKKAHYVISLLFNWIKKKLHLKYHSKAEIIEKYQNKATLKREVIDYYKDWSTTLIILFVLVAYELIVYFTLSASMALLNNQDDIHYTFDPAYVFHSANMAFNATRIIFTPAQQGILEWSLLRMLKSLGGISPDLGDDTKHFVEQSIVLWRTFFTYIPAVLGLIAFGTLTGIQVRSYKKNKSGFITDKYE